MLFIGKLDAPMPGGYTLPSYTADTVTLKKEN